MFGTEGLPMFSIAYPAATFVPGIRPFDRFTTAFWAIGGIHVRHDICDFHCHRDFATVVVAGAEPGAEK
jgi:hypothetical protein